MFIAGGVLVAQSRSLLKAESVQALVSTAGMIQYQFNGFRIGEPVRFHRHGKGPFSR